MKKLMFCYLNRIHNFGLGNTLEDIHFRLNDLRIRILF